MLPCRIPYSLDTPILQTLPGMFLRFLVLADSTFERFIARDLDTLILVRERSLERISIALQTTLLPRYSHPPETPWHVLEVPSLGRSHRQEVHCQGSGGAHPGEGNKPGMFIVKGLSIALQTNLPLGYFHPPETP